MDFLASVQTVKTIPASPSRFELAEAEALFAKGSDQSWLRDPSIIAVRQFTAEKINPSSRKYTKKSECTHYLEVANWVANCDEINHIPVNVRAFAGYAHDLVEDALKKNITGVTPESIVETCWKGDARHTTYLANIIRLITDTPGLLSEEKSREQVYRANTEKSGLLLFIRFADKLCTYQRDKWAFINGTGRFGDLNGYIDKPRKRNLVVQSLNIPEKYKATFSELLDTIEQIVTHRTTPRKTLKEQFLQQAKSFGETIGNAFRSTRFPPSAGTAPQLNAP